MLRLPTRYPNMSIGRRGYPTPRNKARFNKAYDIFRKVGFPAALGEPKTLANYELAMDDVPLSLLESQKGYRRTITKGVNWNFLTCPVGKLPDRKNCRPALVDSPVGSSRCGPFFWATNRPRCYIPGPPTDTQREFGECQKMAVFLVFLPMREMDFGLSVPGRQRRHTSATTNQPSSSPKARLVHRTEGFDRFAARSWLLLGVCPL